MQDIKNRIAEAVSAGFGTKPDEVPELSYEPVGDRFVLEMHPSGMRCDISYVAADPWPPADFWGEAGEKGIFRRFRVLSTRERFLRRLETDRGIAFDVEADGDTLKARPLGRVAGGSEIYALPDAVAAAVRLGETTMRQATAYANAVLRDFRAWQAGEACGLVKETFALEDGEIVPVECDQRWTVSAPAAVAAALPEPQTGWSAPQVSGAREA